MTTCSTLAAAVPAPDVMAAQAIQRRLDEKTKPRGSLGRLEELACRLGAAQGTDRPHVRCPAIVVMAGDHGVARHAISAYPQEVTGQMVLAFVSGGAAINVLGRLVDARVIVADLGVRAPVRHERVVDLWQGPGTRDFTLEPAMSRPEVHRALTAGAALARELSAAGHDLILAGDMGIANTTSACAIATACLGLPAAELAGRGTGIDDDAFQRKIAVIEQGLALHNPAGANTVEVLSSVGGYEVAGLAGLMLGAAACRVPVVIDGVIVTAAALAASKACPLLRHYLIASHRGSEVAHGRMLDHLGLQALFDLKLRLGEGSGAALALPMIRAAVAILDEMATFSEARVTDTGR